MIDHKAITLVRLARTMQWQLAIVILLDEIRLVKRRSV
jgi:hypothetical protein